MCIVGHSERRHVFGDTDEAVRTRRTRAAVARLRPIVCVGETLEEREAGETLAVVLGQLDAGLGGVTTARPRTW